MRRKLKTKIGITKNTHPGAKEELEEKGLSVCRNNLNVRQSIVGASEQTFMKSAKTMGGIKNFQKFYNP